MCNKERKPHVHAELIKVWADGAIVQFFNGKGWEDCYNNEPSWCVEDRYRIKPEPSDVEKYGIEIGDIWRTADGWVLVRSVFPGLRIMVTNNGRYISTGRSLMDELIFRRGVVNKL